MNSTSVRVTWTPLNLPVVDHYTVHYSIVNSGSGRRRRQSNSGSVNYPANVSSGVVSGLLGEQQYQFHVTVTLSVGGMLYMSLPGPSVIDMTGVYVSISMCYRWCVIKFILNGEIFFQTKNYYYLSICSPKQDQQCHHHQLYYLKSVPQLHPTLL